MRIFWLSSLVFLGSCGKGPEPELVAEASIQEVAPLPRTGWDPISIDVEVSEEWSDDSWLEEWDRQCERSYENPEPLLVDADGEPVDLVEMAFDGRNYAWHSTEPLAPGDYTVRGIAECPSAELVLSFTVGVWGQDELFEPASLSGRTYEVEAYTYSPSALTHLAATQLPLTYLEIFDVTGEAVRFRIVTEVNEEHCVVLQDEGQLDEFGLLTWSRDEIVAATEPDPVVMQDMSFQFAFDAAATEAWGGTGAGIADIRHIIDLYDEASLAQWQEDGAEGDPPAPNAACDLLEGFGDSCFSCVDNEETCVRTVFHDVHLIEVDQVLLSDLPRCGVDLEQTVEPFSCDFEIDLGSCSCSSGPNRLTLAGLLVLFGVLWRRKG